MSESIRKKIEERYPAPDRITFLPMIIVLRQAAEFGYQLAQGEKKFKPCGEGDNICSCKSEDECGYLESQDELWIELLRTTMTLRKKSKTDETDKYLFDIEEAKKRYRITRI